MTRYFLSWTYTGPCAPQPPQSELISGAARSFSITGLEEGGSYTFGLTAFNGEGTSPENSATGQTLPAGILLIIVYNYYKELELNVIMFIILSSNWCSKKSSSDISHGNQLLHSVG